MIRIPCHKKRYATRGEASAALNRLRGQGQGVRSRYYCVGCDAWHLTSQKQRRS